MSPFMIRLLIAMIIMLIIAIVIFAIIKRNNKRWEARRKGVSVKATVIDVQTKQDWREEDGWERDEWSGDIKRKKTWQAYYDVTVQWTHPSTGQLYTTRTHIWVNDCTKEPIKGIFGTVRFDQHNPTHFYLDLQSLPEPRPTG